MKAASPPKPRLVGGVHLGMGAQGDEGSVLMVDRGLKSGNLDTIPLTRRTLLILIHTAARALERELESIPGEG